MKVIITGATGMVGEGVLIECLHNHAVTAVLYVGRKPSGKKHEKLTELIISDFMQLDTNEKTLAGYDACFYCAGISSVGLTEAEYAHITYDVTLHFAQVLLTLNPEMVFNFVSGLHTDSTENGKLMWARVKGRTENTLKQLPFKAQYNFRPGLMKPDKSQVHIKGPNRYIKYLFPVLKLFYTDIKLTDLGKAMIAVVQFGYPTNVLEPKDIKGLVG